MFNIIKKKLFTSNRTRTLNKRQLKYEFKKNYRTNKNVKTNIKTNYF